MSSTNLQARYTLLQDSTKKLCKAFAETAPVHEVEKLFIDKPTIIEHGPSTSSVPFLGTFSGSGAVKEYMAILARTLTVSNASYSEPVVNTIMNTACVKGSGHFTWQEGAGKGFAWDEEFVYVLSYFDEQGRIGRWEIWADPLNAWLASQGKRLE